MPCNACHYCLTGHETACETFQKVNNFDPGGFSQLLRVTGRSVETGTLTLPDTMSFEQATFIEPLGTAVRALRAVELKPAQSVLVLGSRVAGLLILKLARALGAGTIIASDVSPNLNYRTGPGTNYTRISSIPDGDTVEILETLPDALGNIWARIGYKEWAAQTYGGKEYIRYIMADA